MKKSEYIEDFLDYLRACEEEYALAVSIEKDMDAQTQDILHCIELWENTQQDYVYEGLAMHHVRKQRREAKDIQRITRPVVDWANDNRKIIREIEKLLGEVRRQERGVEGRTYIPKTEVLNVIRDNGF